MTKPRKKPGKKYSSAQSLKLFALFITVALITIVLLEYIDFKKGQKSFLFTKLIPLERVETKIDRFNQKLEAILKANRISYDYFPDNENKYHFRLDIDDARCEKLIEKIKTSAAQYGGTLELTEIQGFAYKSIMLYKVRFRGEVTHLLLITKLELAKIEERRAKPIEKKTVKPERPQDKPKPQEKEVKEEPVEPVHIEQIPKIAFIIDDMGAYDIGAEELKQLNIPITAAILPDSNRAREVVQELTENRIRMIIHLPMQPTNSNGKHYNLEEVITINSTDAQIQALIRRARQIVPLAQGANSHEGSLATADRALMIRVLNVIKEENLFFVDSRTIARTVAFDVAKELGIRTAHKDVFLDHIQSYSESIAQIRKLVEIARQTGKAIAIGHPFESTFRAIKDSIPYIESKGVKITWVSDLLE
jgi:uncharacterized protein